MTLGQRIQELRKGAGLSQEGLGEALGVSRQAVSKWESDGGIPELDTLIAMSRLFHITIGQLLGVEERKTEEEPAGEGRNEEQMEAILRRYVEESRREEPAPPPKSWFARWGWLVSAAIVVTTVVVVLFAQIGSMRSTIRILRGDISSLQSNMMNVQNQVSGISGEIRDILTEEGKLLSTCAYEVVGVDLERETVTVRFDATLKDYAAGSKLQFLVDWTKTDGTEGQTASDFAEGPDFSAELTLPMNYRSEVSIRVEDPEGNIQEQLVDYVYAFHPESFRLQAYNLTTPFQFIIGRSQTSTAEQAFVDIWSDYPDIYWPERAVLTAWINGEVVFTEEMTVTPSEDEKGQFQAAIEDVYFTVTLKEGDQFVAVLEVTDNLGRTEEFTAGGTVKDGNLNRTEMAMPVGRD